MQVTAITHKNQQWLLVQCGINDPADAIIRSIAGRCWTKTHHGWLIPDTNVNRQRFNMPCLAVSKPSLLKLCNHNAAELAFYRQELILKGYSANTIKTYCNELYQFFLALKLTPANQIKPTDLRLYMQNLAELGHSENHLHSKLNAIKFYYEQVLHKEKFMWQIPRPQKPLILPKVLGQSELGRMFTAVANLKHKAILFTAYSAGLRVSEVCNLKLSDIDSSRMQIFIERAKGKKDRYVILSILLLDVLRSYLRLQKERPVKYLFEGQEAGTPYSSRAAQKVFQLAKQNAGIHKEVGFHSLRHSFATHLLERGVDIRYIKDLLGHFDIRTTERYTHVKKTDLVQIVSPLDDLYNSIEKPDLLIAAPNNLEKRTIKD
jgi:integrase/recombinase XerD